MKMKRTILLSLVLALLLSCFAPMASAAGGATYVLDSAVASKGEQVTLTLKIQNNPGIISLRCRIVYPEDQLKLVSVSDEKLLNGYVQPSPTVSSPYILRWADSLATVNNTSSGAIASLTFQVIGDQTEAAVSIEHVEARTATGSKQEFAGCSAVIRSASSHTHTWGDWQTTTPATCEQAGEKKRTCSGCGEEQTQAIPAAGHKEVADAAVKPTCTASGLTAGKHCSVCKKVLIAQTVIPAAGHSWAPATCTAPKTCSVCGAKEGTALNHDYSVAQHDETAHWMKCSRCDSITAKTAHSFTAHTCDVAAKCTGCGYEKPAGRHSYGAYVQTKAPTCTEKGEEARTCSVCGHQETREVSALNHIPGKAVQENVIPATKEQDGSYDEVIYCTACGKELSRTKKTIPYRDDNPSGLPLIGILGAGPAFPFRDVPASAWYYDAVKGAWQNKLINGVTAKTFCPDANMTVAQAIKLAAALHQLNLYGTVSLKNGTPSWYSTYVRYAIDQKLIEADYGNYTDAQMNQAVTRAEFVHIFHNAVADLWAMNTVADNAIPDVKSTDAYAGEIYDFYRAGIVTGSDAKGTFLPASAIKRSEAAAILFRMYDISARKNIMFQ